VATILDKRSRTHLGEAKKRKKIENPCVFVASEFRATISTKEGRFDVMKRQESTSNYSQSQEPNRVVRQGGVVARWAVGVGGLWGPAPGCVGQVGERGVRPGLPEWGVRCRGGVGWEPFKKKNTTIHTPRQKNKKHTYNNIHTHA